jgi:YggT family protein
MTHFRALLLVALIALAVGFQPRMLQRRSSRAALQTHTNNRAIRPSSQLFEAPRDVEEAHLSQSARDVATISAISLFTLTYLPLVASAAGTDLAVIAVVRPVLDTLVNVLSFFFICRTVFSWYPKTDLTVFPYSAVVWPTEPLLEPVRGLIPPAFGVDISSIVWIMILSFVREILTGQQGILTLLERGG